jgi:uncharacterized protein with von Willebrand factor type A (vWA) domain
MTGFRYGPFNDGPDPLAAPPEIGAAVDDLAQRLMRGENLTDALRDLLREGMAGRRGLDDLARRIRERRKELRSSGQLDGLFRTFASCST